MSLRRSDNLALDLPSPNAVRWNGWFTTLRANAPLPLILIALALLGVHVEGKSFGAYYQRVVMLIGFNIILAVSLQLINGFSGQFSLGHAGFMAVGAYMAAYPALNLSQEMTDPASCVWFYITLAILVGITGLTLLLLFRGIRATRAVHRTLPLILLIALLCWIMFDLARAARHAEPPAIFIWTHLFASIARGFTWLLSHGQPVAASISAWIPAGARPSLTFLVLIMGGGSCAAVVGLIVGMPALRLRGDYLAIATLGFAEIIRILIQNAQPLGGALGLTNIPKVTSFAWLYGFAAITIVVIWRVAYSTKGRAIMAVREDEIAASSVGIDTTHYKVMAFFIGSFFGGVAGALFAMHERSITPAYFGLQKSIEIVVMVTLGGLGSISGAILAAAGLTYLLELLRDPAPLGIWGWIIVISLLTIAVVVWRWRRDRQWLWVGLTLLILVTVWDLGVLLAARYDRNLADFRMIIYSLSLVLMMLLRPQGLLGGIELFPRHRGPKRDAVATEDRDDRKADPV